MWIILVSLMLSNYAYSLPEASWSTSNDTTPSPKSENNSSTPSPTSTPAAPGNKKGGLAKVGEVIGSVYKGVIKGVEYVAMGLWILLQGVVAGTTIVWRQLMTAGVHVFHANHKALVVVYRLYYHI